MSEFAHAYQSPIIDTLTIRVPSPDLSNDVPTNEETIYPMYQRGYDEGEKDGYGRGSENGYYQGYRHGHRDGSEEGYREGIYRGMWFGTAWTVLASIIMFGMKSGRR